MRRILFRFASNENLVKYGGYLAFYFPWLLDFGNKERKQILKKIRPFTLVSYARLRHLWNLVSEVEEHGPGGELC